LVLRSSLLAENIVYTGGYRIQGRRGIQDSKVYEGREDGYRTGY
jgi:hypothetical protein